MNKMGAISLWDDRGDGPKLPPFMGRAQRGRQLNPNAAATIALQQHKPIVTFKPLTLVWTGKTTVVCVKGRWFDGSKVDGSDDLQLSALNAPAPKDSPVPSCLWSHRCLVVFWQVFQLFPVS